MNYHNATSARNTGLPGDCKFIPVPSGLTTGGIVVYRRARFAVPLCNAIAEMAGLAQEVTK